MEYLLAALGAALAGATNAVAGGGTLKTFPLLVWLGVDPVSANITNTVSLWIGSMTSAFGFRRYIKEGKDYLKRLLIPSLLGGFFGAYLLVKTPSDLFRSFVPFLILFATFVLALNNGLIKEVKFHGRYNLFVFVAQFLTSLYGGYFGAGIGILMLASLSLAGIKNIHVANGIKNLLGMSINAIASFYFAFSGLVFWQYASVMMIGFAIGGFLGAKASQKFEKRKVKAFIIAWGLFLSVLFFLT